MPDGEALSEAAFKPLPAPTPALFPEAPSLAFRCAPDVSEGQGGTLAGVARRKKAGWPSVGPSEGLSGLPPRVPRKKVGVEGRKPVPDDRFAQVPSIALCVCGTVCTSKPGLTQHQQHCRQARKAQREGKPPSLPVEFVEAVGYRHRREHAAMA